MNNFNFKTNPNHGTIFIEILQALFITGKLAHWFDFSWAWVLAPTWIPIMFVLIIFMIAFIVGQFKKPKNGVWNLCK